MDDHMQANAHLLDIMHWFYSTYMLYNKQLALWAAQSYIQNPQDAMTQFVLAPLPFAWDTGHTRNS